MAASGVKGVEICKRPRSARSDTDLLNVLKGVSEAQSAEKRTIDALKDMLHKVTTSSQKQQATQIGNCGNRDLEVDDATSMQDAGTKLAENSFGNHGLMVDNNTLQQDMISPMLIEMKVENDRLKEANNALQKEKQQVMKLMDAAIETNVDMRNCYGALSQQYDSVRDQCLALAQKCECLRQQVERQQDQETVLAVSAMTNKDGRDELSGDDEDSDVSTAATSSLSRARFTWDSDASSTLTSGTDTGTRTPGTHLSQVFANQIPARPLARLHPNNDLSKGFASGPCVGEKMIPGSLDRQVSTKQIRATSPPSRSPCYLGVTGHPHILEKVVSGSPVRQIAATRIRAASPLIHANSKQMSSPRAPRTAVSTGPLSVCRGPSRRH